MEEKNRLLNYNNMVIYQDDTKFKFSLDSMLLANFVTLRKRDNKIVDFATGTAPIPLLISNKTKARIYGVEIQKDISELAMKSIKENGLDSKITIINEDIKKINTVLQSDTFDLVTCNPPYFKYTCNKMLNVNMAKSIARHEINLTIEDVIKSSSIILKNGGIFALVFITERFIEVIELLKKYNLQVKKIQFVYTKENKESKIFLIEATKNGKIGMKLLPPLIVHNQDGTYTKKVKEMFEG